MECCENLCACGHTVGGFPKCLKYLFFVINIIFFILGIAVLGVGSYTQTVGNGTLGNIYTVQYPIGFIVLGAIVAVFAFFGCCGAWKESRILLSIYAVVVGLLLIAQIAVVAYAATQGADAPYFTQAWDDTNNQTKNATQIAFNCCGFSDPTDRPVEPCPPNPTGGCENVLFSTTREVLYAGSALLAVEIIGFIVSLVVCCHVHRREKDNGVDIH